MLVGAILGGSVDPQFDINDDGAVDRTDATDLIEGILATHMADFDLDGIVTRRDLVILTAGMGSTVLWSQGDVDLDGTGPLGYPLVCLSAGPSATGLLS